MPACLDDPKACSTAASRRRTIEVTSQHRRCKSQQHGCQRQKWRWQLSGVYCSLHVALPILKLFFAFSVTFARDFRVKK